MTLATLALGLGPIVCGSASAPAVARHVTARAVAPIAVHPVSGLPVIGLSIHHPGPRGKAFIFHVELAATGDEQARGLMFRRTMRPDEGMIFPMQPPRYATFWMRNTVLPLDLVFIGTDGRILSVAEGQPFSDTSIPSGGTVKGVLELNAGRVAALGLGAGDTVRW